MDELRILHLEDDEIDAELIRRRLQSGGVPCQVRRVETRDAFLTELQTAPFDLILSDFTLPAYDGASALAAARKTKPETPFIFVSGTIGEEAAINSLVNGASDYVLKTGDMRRLIPAVERALRDARERKAKRELEEQYRQAQKMEAVGRIASGVAHDFNNLLTAIMGLTELTLEDLPKDSPHRRNLNEVVNTTERAARLTKQLLAFSRKQLVDPRVIDLNALLESVRAMLQRVIREDIELVFKPGAEPACVRIDPGQIEQVIVNMAVNAKDAMPEGGKLVLSTSQFRRNGTPYVRLSVSDTGVGMPAAVRAHLFEPFFTTKELGKGTGLGLATCFGIVKQNGGMIAVESEPGMGTTFHVDLPRAPEPGPEPVKAASKAMPRGVETMLVVEDEEPVRELAVRALRQLGYDVREASNGDQAFEVIERDAARDIKLVMTDVIMPKTGGGRLARELRRMRPDLRILFASGYADDAISREGVIEKGMKFLPKPYSLGELARKVREALDES